MSQRIPISKVLYSTPSSANGVEALGRTHYSYGIAASQFVRMLSEAGVEALHVRHPEQFKSPYYASVMRFPKGRPAHLIFRSSEEIRPIAGAYNIACFAWEFDVLSQPGLAKTAVFESQTSMLSMCDEIWVPSLFTQKVLKAHGFANCHVHPAPIFTSSEQTNKPEWWRRLSSVLSCELASQSTNFLFGYETDFEEDYLKLESAYAKPLGAQVQLSHVLEHGGSIFTSVLNPYDKRKNLANLIEGFLLAAQDREDIVLIIKLATSGVVEMPAGYLYHQFRLLFGHPHCIRDNRVILIGGYLRNEEMAALYQGADFYLCTSIAEGQNIPILEAMSYGCVPVSTRNTAMNDYLSNENCVEIPEQRFAGLLSGLAADVAQRPYEIDFADRFAISTAISSALALSDSQRLSKSAAARAAGTLYSPNSVGPGVFNRLRLIAAETANASRASSTDVIAGEVAD